MRIYPRTSNFTGTMHNYFSTSRAMQRLVAWVVGLLMITITLVANPGMSTQAMAAGDWQAIDAARNIAPQAKVTASGTESGTTKTPDRAIDGVIPESAAVAEVPANHNAEDASRWSADTTNQVTDKNWIQLDFGGTATVEQIQIYWGNTYGKPYYIETSLDGKTWNRVGGAGQTFDGVKAGMQGFTLASEQVPNELRYIKVVTEGKSQQWGISIWEIVVYGDAPVAPAPTQTDVFETLIPYPVKITRDTAEDAGQFVLAPNTAIKASGESVAPASLLAQTLSTATGNAYTVGTASSESTIEYVIDPNLTVEGVGAAQADESYTVNITKDKVTITARTATGALWGTQTLLQLFGPWAQYSSATVNALQPIPAATIQDGPRYSYRGVGVDPSRSFIPVDELKILMRQMSLYKMNILHLHLTDDPGWRLEIPNDGKAADDSIDYSQLTERAGKTAFRENESNFAPQAGRSGYYTLEDYKDIVQTANSLGITIVPEMDGPGHMEAALYSIPELNSQYSYPHPCKEFTGDLESYKELDPTCSETTAPVPSYKNNIKTSLDATNENTYRFTQHVLSVMAQQSNSPYLHIGGDESGVTEHSHYQTYMNTVLPQVAGLGKKAIIWSDALNTMTAANISADTVVQYWTGDDTTQIRNFAAKGGKIIASPATYAYYPQTEDSSLAGPNWACGGAGTECNLQSVYQWNPTSTLGIDESAVLGVEGVSWSEHLRTSNDLQFSMGNRMIAHAEIGWTQQENKDWDRFSSAMPVAGGSSNTQDFTFYLSDLVQWKIHAAVAQGEHRNDAGINTFNDPQGKQLFAYASAPGESVSSLVGKMTVTNSAGKEFSVPVSYELDKAYHKSDAGRTTGRQMNSVFRVYGDVSALAAGTYTAKLTLSSDALGSTDLDMGSLVITRPHVEDVTVGEWESTETAFPTGSHVFPGNDGKAHRITWDEHSFMIDGERLAVWAGEFHPWRIPSPEAWRDVLQKIKSAGFNAVSFYFFWGMYQSEENGDFNFDKGTFRDIDLLLTMAEEEGLYVIVRPGPYVNAEISMGGLPAYMTNYSGKLRSTDPQVLEASKRWLSAFNEIAKKHLITADGNGSIILYQVENELLEENAQSVAFLKALTDHVRSEGIDVPLFENDWGRAGRFAPNNPNTANGTTKYGTDFYAYDYYPMGFDCSATRKQIDDTEAFFRSVEPDAPQMIAESQGGAFTPWGANYGANDCTEYTDDNFTRQWTAVRLGNGVKAHTYYMSYGGTNWGYTGSPASGFTSYDYGAAIDEDRTLRNDKYGAQKEEAYFMEANSAYLTSLPVAAPQVQKRAGSDEIKGYQRIATDKETSVTGNGSRSLSFLLKDTNATGANEFNFALDLNKTEGVSEKYSHDSADAEIKYSGAWQKVDSGGAWKGSVMESSTKGDTATFTFTGTGIEVVVGTGTDQGKFSVQVDNQAAETATGYVQSNQNKPDQFVAFKKDGLAAGKHTVVITNLAQSAAQGITATKVQVDALNILGAVEPTAWLVVNDSDAGIKYTGTWTHDQAKNWTKNDINNDEHSSPRAGDFYEYEFEGVGIDIIGPYSTNHGSATVYIDGVEVGKTSEQVTTNAQGQKVFFSKRDLDPTKHTLKVVVDGTPFSGSSGTYAALDALRVFPDTDSVMEFTSGTSVRDGKYSWSKIPQKDGASLTIHGRDALVLVADMKIADHNLLYTTSHLFGKPIETDSANVQYLLGARGDDGETLLEYSEKPEVIAPEGVEVTWNDEYKQLRLNYSYQADPQDITIVPQGNDAARLTRSVENDSQKPLRLRIIDRDYGIGTYLISTGDGTSANRIAVENVDFARTVSFDGDTVNVTGSVDEATQAPRILVPVAKTGATWNGSQIGEAGDDGFVEFEPQALPTVKNPHLVWKVMEETPEAQIDFDDSAWEIADDTTSANPSTQGPAQGSTGGVVLDSNHYGFYEGSVWYRATFTANADDATVTLRGTGAASQYAPRSMEPAFLQVWANGEYLGAKSADGKNQTFQLSGISDGTEVTLAVLVNNLGQNLDWNDNGYSKQNRGLYSAVLPAENGEVEWKIQGAEDKTGTEIDPVRGLYNVGGMYGERNGWYLPEYDDSQWEEYDGDMHNTDAGITWYRANFTLDTPADSDVAYRVEVLASDFDEQNRSGRTDHSQATIYVNGWNTAIYIGDVGPQNSFTIPRAFLNMNGANSIAVAVNAKDAEEGPDNIVIRAVHTSYMGALAPKKAASQSEESTVQEVNPVKPPQSDDLDTVTIPDVPGVVYLYEGKPVEKNQVIPVPKNGEVVITAIPADGYSFVDGAETSWRYINPEQTLTPPAALDEQPGITEPGTSTQLTLITNSNTLARTGSDVIGWLICAAVLAVSGVAFIGFRIRTPRRVLK